MNRRNVLGNRIEESNTLWIVLTGLVVTALQLGTYHRMEHDGAGLLLAAVWTLLGGMLVHFVTKEQEELVAYLLIPFAGTASVGIWMLRMPELLSVNSHIVLAGSFFTWLIPVLYATVYTWANGSSETGAYAKMYKRSMILFYLVYFSLIIYDIFFYSLPQAEGGKAQWIPFATFAALMDGVMKDTVSLARVGEFLAARIVFFLPYGFLIGMLGRKWNGLLKMFLLLLLPVGMELLQLFCHLGTCDADDMIFRYIGSLLGLLLFLLYDLLCQHFTSRHFDGSEINRDYYGRKI